MSQDNEDFLRRWSKRKHAAAKAAPAPQASSAPPALPALDSLTFESDFTAFMHSKVEESVKRAALKKLFSDPRLNVIDPLDIDIDDYSNLERLPEAAVKALEHAKRALLEPREEDKPEPQAEPARAENESKDGDPRQDA